MVLNAPLNNSCFISNTQVSGFTRDVENNHPGEQQFRDARMAFEENLLKDLFSFRQINYHMVQLSREIQSFASSLVGSVLDFPVKIYPVFDKEILQVSDKFLHRIRDLLIAGTETSKNAPLQEKIKGASGYFLEKVNSIITESLESIQFETDNKEVKKTIQKVLETIDGLVHIKKLCLQACSQGFELGQYLEAKAKAQLSDIPARKRSVKTDNLEANETQNQTLYESLINWRNRKAEEEEIPHYMVLHVKTLKSLSNFAPASLKEMKRIKGIGKATLNKYGGEILEIIRESGILSQIPEEEVRARKRSEKKDKKKQEPKHTSLITYDLYLAGKTPEQIAEERKLAVSTIESHLAEMVGEGMLDVRKFVGEEKLSLISDYFKTAESEFLRDAKEALGQAVTFSELRFVQKHLNKKNQPETGTNTSG
jgi:hypothetical protein